MSKVSKVRKNLPRILEYKQILRATEQNNSVLPVGWIKDPTVARTGQWLRQRVLLFTFVCLPTNHVTVFCLHLCLQPIT